MHARLLVMPGRGNLYEEIERGGEADLRRPSKPAV